MSWTPVPRRSREETTTSGAVPRPAVVPRVGAGDRARQYSEKVSFPCGRDPRFAPGNAGGSTKSSLARKITSAANWNSEGVLPKVSISTGIGSKSITRAVTQSIPVLRRPRGNLRFRKDKRNLRPGRAMLVRPRHNHCRRRGTRHRFAGSFDRRRETHAWAATRETKCGISHEPSFTKA